jgi:5-methylcytosine-specific restriction endonuclease McrA
MGNICYSVPARRNIVKSTTLVLNAQQSPVKKPLKKKSIPKAMKRLVWDTYIGEDIGRALCTCCNHVYIRQIEFHCGHVVAEANGGQLNIDNLRPICAQCNLSMRTMNMEEFKKMFVRPI